MVAVFQMKKIALILAATLWTSGALAEERVTAETPLDAAQSAGPASIDAAQPVRVAPSNLCSRTDPYIEYRDCVNATTRDANAKVRMA
jgi:hypothetical protein